MRRFDADTHPGGPVLLVAVHRPGVPDVWRWTVPIAVTDALVLSLEGDDLRAALVPRDEDDRC